jgi:hypothetical protein
MARFLMGYLRWSKEHASVEDDPAAEPALRNI